MPTTDIAARMRAIILEKTSERRRAKELEEVTGVPATNWRNFWAFRQRPTSQMIEGVAKCWPHYALWLVTGVTDEANGHSLPEQCIGKVPFHKARLQDEEDSERYLRLSAYMHFLVHADDQEMTSVESEAPQAYKQKTRLLDEAIGRLAQEKWIEDQKFFFGLYGLNKAEQFDRLQHLRVQLTNQRMSRTQTTEGVIERWLTTWTKTGAIDSKGKAQNRG